MLKQEACDWREIVVGTCRVIFGLSTFPAGRTDVVNRASREPLRRLMSYVAMMLTKIAMVSVRESWRGH